MTKLIVPSILFFFLVTSKTIANPSERTISCAIENLTKKELSISLEFWGGIFNTAFVGAANLPGNRPLGPNSQITVYPKLSDLTIGSAYFMGRIRNSAGRASLTAYASVPVTAELIRNCRVRLLPPNR